MEPHAFAQRLALEYKTLNRTKGYQFEVACSHEPNSGLTDWLFAKFQNAYLELRTNWEMHFERFKDESSTYKGHLQEKLASINSYNQLLARLGTKRQRLERLTTQTTKDDSMGLFKCIKV